MEFGAAFSSSFSDCLERSDGLLTIASRSCVQVVIGGG